MTDGATVDLLLFEISGQLYGADASQVLRIDRSGAVATKDARALVVRTDSGEGRVRVDAVHGVSAVPVDALRRLPAAAAGVSYAIGVWLRRDHPVLLVDLLEMLKAK